MTVCPFRSVGRGLSEAGVLGGFTVAIAQSSGDVRVTEEHTIYFNFPLSVGHCPMLNETGTGSQ